MLYKYYKFCIMVSMSYIKVTSQKYKRLPPGYTYTIYKDVKYITIDDTMYQAVKHAFMLMARGNYFIQDICTLTERIYGVYITPHRMKDVLRDPFYCGFIGERRHIYEPLVTKELFEQVQDALKKDRAKPRNAEKSKQKYKYSGVFKCSDCGCNTSATVAKGRYTYYVCNAVAPKYNNHKRFNISEKKIDEELSGTAHALGLLDKPYSIRELNTLWRSIISMGTIGSNGITIKLNDAITKDAIEPLLQGTFIKPISPKDPSRSEFELFLDIPRTLEEIMHEFNMNLSETQERLLDLQLDNKVDENESGKWINL